VRKALTMLQDDTEWNDSFIQEMANRMAVGRHRYGSIYGPEHVGRDMIRAMRSRITHYEETGNTEVLRDIANFAMIEASVPHHPKAHFKPLEHEDTPPVYRDGKPWTLESER